MKSHASMGSRKAMNMQSSISHFKFKEVSLRRPISIGFYSASHTMAIMRKDYFIQAFQRFKIHGAYFAVLSMVVDWPDWL